MTILEELKKYAHDCINDVITSGKKHKWACQRFLEDIDKSNLNILKNSFEFYWNEEEAQKIVDWFRYLRHSKGVLAGKSIELTTWQKFCLCQIYGWRHIKTDYKRFTMSFIEVARKNAKSQMEAGVVLYEMATQSTRNKEIYECYCAGTKRDQSEIIFTECINLLNGSPLRSKFNITKKKITHIKTGSFLKALNKEDGKKGDGSNPAILVLDEYHQHETTEFYELSYGSNTKESLLMIITTAGKDLTYPCFTQEYELCSKILNPNVDVTNENYFVDICEIDEEDNPDDKGCWPKANPIRMYYDEGIKKITEAYEIAKNTPEKMVGFLTKCLNRWVQATDKGYMDMKKFKACQVKKILYDLKGRRVFVGFDMSSKIDLTSVAFVIPILERKKVIYIVFTHSFIPNEEKLRERTLKDKVPYSTWLGKYLTITNTPVVDQGQVMEYVVKFCKENELVIDTLCFDPANASKLMLELSNEGYSVEEVYQSHKSLNEATEGFREEVYCKNVIYLENPLFNFAMSNAVISRSNGLIKIDKDATKKKIDPVDATLCAYKLARYFDVKQEFDINKSVDSFLERFANKF